MPPCVHGVSPLGACPVCTPPEPPVAVIRSHAEHHRLSEGDLVRAANGELLKVTKHRRYDDYDKTGPVETWLEHWSDEYAIWLTDDGMHDNGEVNIFPLTVVDVVPRRGPAHVYVLGWSPENDTIWGVYSSREAAEEARAALGRQEGESGPVGWIEEVPLRTSGSVPDRPVVG